MKSIALANPQALFAYAMGVESSHICFLYTWSRQGSCGVVPGQLLVFPIAPLNLWTTRDPRTSHDTPTEGKEARETTEQPFVVPTCGRCPTTTTRVQAKGVTTANTLVLYIPSSSSRAITTMLTSGKQRRALKPINYYYRLCKEKRKVVTIVFFFFIIIVKLYKLRFLSVCFDRDWIFNPMTKCISPRCSCKVFFYKNSHFLVKAMNKPLNEMKRIVCLIRLWCSA